MTSVMGFVMRDASAALRRAVANDAGLEPGGGAEVTRAAAVSFPAAPLPEYRSAELCAQGPGVSSRLRVAISMTVYARMPSEAEVAVAWIELT